ncbi:MAG: phosphoribosylanthranilate isomerase [Salinimicrobium sediminis]|nr:phosphoribosylanthranilate isomerase [Salinimicrobium sediminis]
MNLKLKVCGMREAENIKAIAGLKPDYLGLIFFEGSSRYVSGEIQELDKEIKKTGVFVNASEEDILEKIEKYALAAIQLHGEESGKFCKDIKSRFSEAGKKVEIIKVFSIKDDFDFQELKAFEGIADLYLFDTKGKNRGGNGIAFNWNVLLDYPSSTPFLLSGGIGSEETEAIKELYKTFQKRQKEHLFYGIDVNSKFETAPGLKDPEALRSFKKQLFK